MKTRNPITRNGDSVDTLFKIGSNKSKKVQELG